MNVSQVTNDILNNPRFEGAIDSISWLTDWIDVGFGMAITLVAFLIILVAMFKNVLAAAYCAYPKFWNSVHEAHETKRGNENTNVFTQMIDMFQGMGSSRGGSLNGGTVGMIIMGILPDIKNMTDFENDTLSPKNYFMKAIPQMLVCVILGAFIYNGTYRDVAAKVVDFGSTMVSRTLLSFDPIAAFDDFTGSAGRPVFSTDGAVMISDQRVNSLATNMYTSIVGTYKDITTAEQKRVLADNCEAMARVILDQATQHASIPSDILSDESYSLTLKMSWSSAYRDTASMSGLAGSNPTVYQYASCISLEDIGVPTSESHESYVYLVAVMQFTKGTAIASGTGYNDLVLHLPSSSSIPADGTISYEYRVGKTTDGSAYFNSNPGSITVKSGGNTIGTLSFVRNSDSTSLKWEPVTGVSVSDTVVYELSTALKLIVNDNVGTAYTYTITSVKFDGGAVQLTSDSDATGTAYPTSMLSPSLSGSPAGAGTDVDPGP